MTFRDRLAPGSFRGVAFKTPSSERTGGQRGIVHEYPNSDDPTTQRLGRMPTRFRLTAYVIGPDYDLDRDALIEALDKPGPGRLVHYWYGAIDVEVEPNQTYTVRESQDQLGMAIFEIPFIVSKRRTDIPKLTISRYDAAKIKGGNAILASMRSFADKLDTSGIEQVRSDVMDTITGATTIINDVNSQISTIIATPTQVAGMITSLGNSLATLVSTPSRFDELASGINAVIEATFGALANIGRALWDSSRTLDGTGQTAAAAQSEARRAVRTLRNALRQTQAIPDGDTDNDRAVNGLVKQTAAVHAALAALEMPFDNQGNAQSVRDELDATLAALAAVADDNVYGAMSDFRADLAAHLTSVAGGLARTIDYTPAVTLPALLIAHRIHGDARRAEEIIARNNVRHPGFVAGGYPVKVLADG